MRGGGGIDRARTFSGGDLVGDGGEVLGQVVVKFGGQPCALLDAQLRFGAGDLAAEQLTARKAVNKTFAKWLKTVKY